MLQEIDHLREIADRCRGGGALDPSLAKWLGACLDRYLTRRVSHMDEAFGIRSARGGVPWRMEVAIRERDAALRAFARQLPSFLSVRARARTICQLSTRYAATAWRFDKDKSEMPQFYAGTPNEQLWTAFRSGAPMPLGERRVSEIITK